MANNDSKWHAEISLKVKCVTLLSDPGVAQLNLLLFVVSDHHGVLWVDTAGLFDFYTLTALLLLCWEPLASRCSSYNNNINTKQPSASILSSGLCSFFKTQL